jgi:hypothetical protein
MEYDPEKINFFAQTDARGKQVRFGIKAKDRLRHTYVIGKTGMGKSTMLENMAIQDIQNGEGVAFIDPHGSAAEKLLDYVPEDRVEDVLYFAPFDMEYPVAFNIMEDVGADKRHLVVSGLMSVFEKIWVDAWSARMAYILQNTLMALLEYPDSTLLGVNRMLSDKNYRNKVVDNVKDPAVKSFWTEEFAKYTDRFAAEATPAIQNKIGQFTSNPLIRNIIGQPRSSFDIRKMMDEKKILIMNLSKGLVGESNANLLGSMLTTRIYLAAMSRANLNRQQMEDAPNFYFYVDEFQSFANATFASILSESRKYKLNLTIAHQYIEQMEEEVKNAVFGNVGTIVSFRVGPFDAEVLETIFAPQFTATDIVNLGFAQIYLTLMIDGIGSQPFSATTLPPVEAPSISYKDMVIAASRRKYAGERTTVEEEVERFHKPLEAPTQSQHKNGNADGRQNNSGGGQRMQRPQNGQSGGRNGQNERRRRDDNGRKQGEKERREPSRDRQERREPVGNRKPKRTDLDDLRSVLQKIANDGSDTKKEGGGDARSLQQNPVQQNGLRDTLKGVLKDAVATEGSSQEKPKKEEMQVAHSEKTQTTNATQETTERQPQVEAKSAEVNPDVQNTKEDVSPKELERMMRVTTSDKSPFR